MTGDIGNAVRDERRRRTMREFLAHYIRMKRTNFDFVDWEAADKVIEHSP